MTDDIVELLHSIGRLRTMDLGNIPTVAREAAAEIERLRKAQVMTQAWDFVAASIEIERLRALLVKHDHDAAAEIERLRAALKEIAWHDAQSPAAAIARQVLGHE